jgi:hypothetical protein
MTWPSLDLVMASHYYTFTGLQIMIGSFTLHEQKSGVIYTKTEA